MQTSPFHAMVLARTLMGHVAKENKLIAAYAASDIEVYPYQVAAARFAMRSPYLKGCILCDDASLGKSYEAMLVITQTWYEDKTRILIVVPTPLLGQWVHIMETRFSVPFVVLDTATAWDAQLESGNSNPFEQDGAVLTSYNFATEKADFIAQIPWHLAVFEEAHHLRRIYTGENRSAVALRDAVGSAFKLLLTATPMQNSIMDLYGLIYFIDETALPDADSFYKRYFRRPENYPELAGRVSKYCFRTTRPQVAGYVKIPNRVVMTASLTLTPREQQLYELLNAYLQKPDKAAFPKMERYDLALMLLRTFSSSTYAIAATLYGVVNRLAKLYAAEPNNQKTRDELAQLKEMLSVANSITENAKGSELLTALKKGFAQLNRLGAKRKALIFTENRATQKYLFNLLDSNGYASKVLTLSGGNSRDYTIIERFEREAEILIATDIAAAGFNLEFCSFVINYDLPYNTLTIEQRVSRCHRQGQQTDVLVLNFLNQNNFADVRMLELVNKRTLQFGGIFGLSDSAVGGFGVDLSRSFAAARTKAEIDSAYSEVLEQFEDENKRLTAQAEHSLFTSFDREVAKGVTVTPQYIKDNACKISDDLWALTRYFFGSKYQFHLDEETRTLSCVGSPPKVFTGAVMRRSEYSMAKGYRPASGRHTITGPLARNILKEILWVGIPDRGTVTVDAPIEPCEIGYYRVRVKSQADFFSSWNYDVFVGKSAGGRILSHDECANIMALPVVSFTKGLEVYGDRDGLSKPKPAHPLDALIAPAQYIQRAASENESSEKEEIERLKASAADQKAALNGMPDALRSQVKAAEQSLDKAKSQLEKLETKKHLASLQKELKASEQNLFTDGLRIDVECERQIKGLLDKAKYTAAVKRQFVIQVIHNS